jgi:hypothetical protein
MVLFGMPFMESKLRGAQFQPFSLFKGSHNLVGMGCTTDLSKKSGVPQYEMKRKRLDSIVYIDVRPFIKECRCRNQCNTIRTRKIFVVGEDRDLAREIHLYPYLNPWLVLTVYFSGHREGKK